MIVFTKAEQNHIEIIWEMIKEQKQIYQREKISLWSDDYPTLEDVKEDFYLGNLYVLKQDDVVIASLSQTNSLLEDHSQDDNVCYLSRLIVKPALQNQGFGTQIIRLMEQVVWENNYIRIEFFVSENNQKAMNLYERLGYKDLGYYQTPWENEQHRFHRFYKNRENE
jgi:RimJ/RimL family protein N-acetyltransferase